MFNDDHTGKDFIVGAMIGSTLGALTAAMFTTKKGHKVQKDIASKYHELEGIMKKYVNGKKRKVKNRVRKVAKKARSKVKRAKKTINK